MKVLMTTTSSSLMDGINRHILTVSKGLHERGLDVAVCITQPGGELALALEAAGVRAYSLNARNGHDVRIIWRLSKIMNEFRPDIVHIHVLPFFAKVLFSIRYKKLKYVVTVHGISDPVEHKTIYQKTEEILEKLFCIKFGAYCYISEGVRRHSANVVGEVVYNPIDFKVFQQGVLRHELGIAETVPVIGTACRIADVKRPVAFTEVMVDVLQKMPTVHAVVIGDGDSIIVEKMRKIVAVSGVESRFHFLGARTNARELIADFDCFVLTSAREGMPTTILEAMSARVPVAFWKGDGGLIDLELMNELDGPFAVIIKSRDIQELSGGIIQILKSGSEIEVMRSREMDICKRYFSLDKIIEKLYKIYGKVMGN